MPGLGFFSPVTTFLQAVKLANLYKLHTSLRTLTDNEESLIPWHSVYRRRCTSYVAANDVCTVQYSICCDDVLYAQYLC